MQMTFDIPENLASKLNALPNPQQFVVQLLSERLDSELSQDPWWLRLENSEEIAVETGWQPKSLNHLIPFMLISLCNFFPERKRMNGKYFIDSNIFLYTFTDDDVEKHEIAKAIVLNGKQNISVQMISEVSNNLIKKVKI